METGVGKTYTYIKTIYAFAKLFVLSKGTAGVLSSGEMSVEAFREWKLHWEQK